LRRQIAAYKAALAIKLHPGRVVAWAAALAVAVGGYLWFTGEPANTSAAVAAAARVELASASSWADTGPKIFEVAGQPYWAIIHYDLETGVVDLRQRQGGRRSRAQHSPAAHGKAAP
jgi:hypothetical protein